MRASDGTPVELTAKEFELLSFLARHAGKSLHPADDPGRGVGPRLFQGGAVLHAYVHRLRQKLGPEAGVVIKTSSGIGYVLTLADG